MPFEAEDESEWNEPVNLPDDVEVLWALLQVDPNSDPVGEDDD